MEPHGVSNEVTKQCTNKRSLSVRGWTKEEEEEEEEDVFA